MKKILITMTLLLTLTAGLQAASQRHRHTPQQTVLADSTSQDAVEVYSDTTSATASDTTVTAKRKVTVTTRTSPWSTRTTTYELDADEDDSMSGIFNSIFRQMDGNDITAILFALGALCIIFVLAPVLIIIALFYFINKNRKEKMRLAQMAVQQGQPIPDRLLEDRTENTDDEYQKGMRQCFVGVGLMIFLGYAAGQVGFGIGALVFCIGLGKVFASRTAKRTDDLQDRHTGR